MKTRSTRSDQAEQGERAAGAARGPAQRQATAPSRYQQMASDSPQAAQLMAQAQLMAGGRPVQRVEEETLQGKFATVQRAEDEELLQGKFATVQRAEDMELLQGKFAPVQRAEKPNNTGLPNPLKSGIESLSGMSMDHVKVHYNSDKPDQLQAHAYAQGSEIHVAPGQERHLPHEAWHVVQQAQGRVRPTVQIQGNVQVNDDVGLESEADLMGGKAVLQGAGMNVVGSRQNLTPNVTTTVKEAPSLTGMLNRLQPVTQRALNPANGTKPGRMPDTELGGLDNFLTNHGHTAANYVADTYVEMTNLYRGMVQVDTAMGKASSSQKRRQHAITLESRYAALETKANDESMDPDSDHWDESVASGVAQYFDPAGNYRNVDAHYTAIGTDIWPGRNPQPEAFWKAIRTACRKAHAAANVNVAAVAMSSVLHAAKLRFQAFQYNVQLNRGAWAGSNTHGDQPPDYVQTTAGVIANLTARQVAMGGRLGVWWIMTSGTAPSGQALHRSGVDARGDFIYHL